MRRHDRALKYGYKYGYNPAQPRDDHGRWTGGADSNDHLTRVAGGGRSIGIGGGRIRASDFPGLTYGQLLRLELNIVRAENALQQIRQYDPNWRPRAESATSFPSGTEGAIAESEARAVEAETRLDQFRRGIGGNFGPPLDPEPPRAELGSVSPGPFDGEALIDAYRTANTMPDLFGRPTWPNDRGTVAVTTIDGKVYFGVNSLAPGYSDSDFKSAQAMRDVLVKRYPDELSADNPGRVPNDSFFHAKSTVLLRAARANDGTLAGRDIEIHADREMCSTSCEIVLPKIGLELGNPRVTYIDGYGRVKTMQDGKWQ